MFNVVTRMFYRVIGDLKRSKINATVGQADTYCPETMEKAFAEIMEIRRTADA